MSKVLLIEANRSHANLIRDRLKKGISSVKVDMVATVKRAIQLIREREYDCILTEYATPEVSGARLIRTLRKEAGDIPIVVVTGRGDHRVGIEMIRQGASDYIHKSRSTLDAIPEVVKKTIVKRHVEKSPLYLPAHVIAFMHKTLDEVEKTIARELRSKIRRIKRNAKKLLTG